MATIRIHLHRRQPRPLPCHLSPCDACRDAGRIWFSSREAYHERLWQARQRVLLRRWVAVMAALAAAIVLIGVIA